MKKVTIHVRTETGQALIMKRVPDDWDHLRLEDIPPELRYHGGWIHIYAVRE